MPTPRRSRVKVADNVSFGQSLGRSFFALSLERPDWTTWNPGQFVMLRPQRWTDDVIWARPLSICRVMPDNLILFYQVIGRGTSQLAQLKAGDDLIIWGPLGNGFALEPDTPTLLLAGGIGLAPFVSYVDTHPKPGNLSMLFGHRFPMHYYPADFLGGRIKLDCLHEQTPADLERTKQTVEQKIKEYAARDGLVLACGPMPFLLHVWQLAQQYGARAQLSLEQRMACGTGVCLGCVAKTSLQWPEQELAGLPVQTCSKGPIFWAHELDLPATAPYPQEGLWNRA